MTTPYDTFDYPPYWKNRAYEHYSEFIAIKHLLGKIPSIKKALEIGGGFGRLVPSYLFRAKRVILSDPSAKILGLARKKLGEEKKIEFVQSSLENLSAKFRKKSFDLVVLVRVLHHLSDVKKTFEAIADLTSNRGYFILEFANKNHLKAVLAQILKGNFGFIFEKKSKDIRCPKYVKAKTLPFINYHPKYIEEQLKSAGFDIIEKLSVSNIRSPGIKKYVSTEILLSLEKLLQKPLSFVNFGPSIFILAQKLPKT